MTKEELNQIITEYELHNGIDVITEEELLDMIPESDLYPNLYGGDNWCIIISDYEAHLMKCGFNPFTGETYDLIEKPDDSMLINEIDIVDENELEFLIAEEMEFYDSLRSKISDIYVSNTEELTKLLQNTMNETIYRLLIHLNAGDRKFLIIVTDMVQFYWYKVLLESGSGKSSRLKYIGSDCNPNSVLLFINYYLETGQPLYGI